MGQNNSTIHARPSFVEAKVLVNKEQQKVSFRAANDMHFLRCKCSKLQPPILQAKINGGAAGNFAALVSSMKVAKVFKKRVLETVSVSKTDGQTLLLCSRPNCCGRTGVQNFVRNLEPAVTIPGNVPVHRCVRSPQFVHESCRVILTFLPSSPVNQTANPRSVHPSLKTLSCPTQIFQQCLLARQPTVSTKQERRRQDFCLETFSLLPCLILLMASTIPQHTLKF